MMFRAGLARDTVLLLSAGCLLTGWSFFDPFHKHVEKGNRNAAEEQSEAALQDYGEAAKLEPGSPIPDFNRGIVLLGEGEAEAAADAFAAAAAAEKPEIVADALYNLGNVLMESQEFGPAVESYLKSLDLDPIDADAQKNLEIAVRRLEEQQQQQQQQQENQEKNEEGEKKEERPQDSPPDSSESQNEAPDEQDEEEEAKPPPEEGPPEERLTREDAERLLNAIESDELKVLEQLQSTDEEARGVVTNDW